MLMSVYHRVDEEALALCLDSLIKQTRLPDQFVIVRDGPLGDDLERHLSSFNEKLPGLVSFVTLDQNQGLINALNAGLDFCLGDWILRMDADDVATPDRIETQLSYLANHPETDVLGSSMLEFEADPANPLRHKPVAVTHEEIRSQLPYRNPINHPTVCIRKSLLQSVNGYPSLHFLEDYLLWVRLMHAGARFHNLEKPLHLYRFDADTLARRAGIENFRNECRLRWWMFNHGMIGPLTLATVIILQLVLRFAPTGLRRYLWQASRHKI